MSSLVLGTLSSTCSSQTRFFSCFLLHCRDVEAFALSVNNFCPEFLFCPAFLFAFSELILFSRQLTLVGSYFHLHQMNMPTLNLNDFFPNSFLHRQRTIAEPSLTRDGHHGIAMAIDWPLGNVIIISELHWNLSTGTFRPRFQAPSVSAQLRGNVALKASQSFVQNFID